MSPSLLTITNNGPALVETNYWQSEFALKGLLYLSFNAGAARLLVPGQLEQQYFHEIKTAKKVVIRHGKSAVGFPLWEIEFDDGSDSPFVVHLSDGQADRRFVAPSGGSEALQFFVVPESRSDIQLPGSISSGDLNFA